MKKLIFILLAVSACIGCAPSIKNPADVFVAEHPNVGQREIIVYIDPAFPSDVAQMIEMAALSWQINLGGLVKFKFVNAHNDCFMDGTITNVICVRPIATENISFADGLTSYYRWYHSAIVRIADDNYSFGVVNRGALVRQVALHEFGHALGLHHNEAGNIMCADGSHASQYITRQDIEQYLDMVRHGE